MKEEIKHFKNSIFNLINRKQFSLTGVEKISNLSPTQLLICVTGENLMILGENLEVQKYDIESGILEVTGLFFSMKYQVAKDKTPLLKRIFK